MKILIEIDDNDYADIMSDSERNLNHYERLIKKGVPLPKGHGDLKDVDHYRKMQWEHPDYSLMDDEPTIIEADNAESEG